MGIVLLDMAMSLDGMTTNSNGKSLYPIEQLRNTSALNEIIRTTGAVVMDRAAYEEAAGDFTGYEYQMPIFVLTDKEPETVAKGENDKLRFNFITEGIDKVVEYAKRAAGDLNVTLVGGVAAARLCLKAGLLDEILVRRISLLVGGGTRFFEDFGEAEIKLKIVHSVAFVNRIDTRYRIVR